jgi:hypothetical protein
VINVGEQSEECHTYSRRVLYWARRVVEEAEGFGYSEDSLDGSRSREVRYSLPGTYRGCRNNPPRLNFSGAPGENDITITFRVPVPDGLDAQCAHLSELQLMARGMGFKPHEVTCYGEQTPIAIQFGRKDNLRRAWKEIAGQIAQLHAHMVERYGYGTFSNSDNQVSAYAKGLVSRCG